MQGGGIHGDVTPLTLVNSTVSGNSADAGSAIFYENGGELKLISSTLSGTIYAFAGAVAGIDPPEPLSVASTGTLIDGEGIQEGDGVTWTSNGHNIESPGNTCGFDRETDQVEQTAEELKLGPLQDNGGATMTHALLQGSNAIDQIPETDCEVDSDQRGEPRPAGEADSAYCDKGAFEWQPLNDFCKPLTNYEPACYPVCEDFAELGGFIHNCVDVSFVAECYEANDCSTDTCEAEWAAWLDDCVGGP
jgi:hypothetical protein